MPRSCPQTAQQELMGYVSSMQAAGMDDGTIATQLMRAALSQSDGATYTGNLKRLGVSDPDDPEAINLFPKDFEAKDRIADRIAEYNKSLPEDAQLAYTDYIAPDDLVHHARSSTPSATFSSPLSPFRSSSRRS